MQLRALFPVFLGREGYQTKETYMEDRAIIDLFWQRAEEAITECGRRYGRYCQAIARNILRNPEDGRLQV
jgi:hypothetical protein